MDAVTSNGPNLYAYLARRMRVALGEFDDTNRDLEGLVKELAEFKRAHLAQPSQAVDVVAVREVIAECQHVPIGNVQAGALEAFIVQLALKLTRAIGNAQAEE